MRPLPISEEKTILRPISWLWGGHFQSATCVLHHITIKDLPGRILPCSAAVTTMSELKREKHRQLLSLIGHLFRYLFRHRQTCVSQRRTSRSRLDDEDAYSSCRNISLAVTPLPSFSRSTQRKNNRKNYRGAILTTRRPIDTTTKHQMKPIYFQNNSVAKSDTFPQKSIASLEPGETPVAPKSAKRVHLLQALQLKHLKQVRQVRQTASSILKRSEHVQPSHRNIKMSHMQKSSAHSTMDIFVACIGL